jgi:O-antigen/teichoic acid export membrane protein
MAFTFAVSIISARMLGVKEFGELGLLLSTSAAYAILAGAWLGVLATKLVSECLANTPEEIGSLIGALTSSTLLLAAPLTLLLFYFAPQIALHIIQAPSLSKLLQWVAILQALNAIDSLQQGVIAGLENYRSALISSLLRGLIALPITIAGIYYARLEGALLATVLANGCIVAVNAALIQRALRQHRTYLRFDTSPLQFLRHHTHLLMPSFLGAILGAPILWILNTQMSRQPDGYIQVALFSAANQWKNAILFLPRKFGSAALPIMAHAPHGRSRLFTVTQSISILVCTPFVCSLYFLSSKLSALYGSEFHGAAPIFIGVLLVTGLSSVGAGASVMIVSRGRMWLGLWTNIISSSIQLTLGYMLIPSAGAEGVLWAMAIAAIANLILTFIWMKEDFESHTIERASAAILTLSIFAIVARQANLPSWPASPLAGAFALAISYWILIDRTVRNGIESWVRSRIRKTMA